MPMTELPGHHVPIRLWADPTTVEPQALQQLFNVTTLPQIAGVAVMPDVHVGKGATVGRSSPMRDAVVPGRGRRRHRLRDDRGEDLAHAPRTCRTT